MNCILFRIIVLAIISLFVHKLGAAESSNYKKSKKYTLSVCAIVKNEAKYLKEWIEFHRLVGVDHFYLYNNGNIDSVQKVLNPYIRKGIVTLIDWSYFSYAIDDEKTCHWSLSTQIPAYENAIKFRAIRATKWLALLNTDEYLVPVDSYSMKDLLRQYDSYPAILLGSDVFDGSQVNLSLETHMLIESRDLIKPPDQNSIRNFTKIILKPELCAGFAWPPYQVLFKNNQQPIALKKSDMRITRYVNRDKFIIDTLKHKLYLDTKQMSASAISALLDQGYAIEDQEQLIFRYLPELRKQCLGNDR